MDNTDFKYLYRRTLGTLIIRILMIYTDNDPRKYLKHVSSAYHTDNDPRESLKSVFSEC